MKHASLVAVGLPKAQQSRHAAYLLTADTLNISKYAEYFIRSRNQICTAHNTVKCPFATEVVV